MSYPKQFTSYKWFKPLLTVLLTSVFTVIFASVFIALGGIIGATQGFNVMDMLGGGYNKLDAYSVHGAIISLGNVVAALPALMLANRIVNSRSFSSYSSSRGGFDFGLFFKLFVGALVCFGIPLTVTTLLTEEYTGNIRFTVFGLILCIILVPLQCCAEEYIFRGLAMQTFGSWIKIPVIPIILQTVLFALVHPYNILGVVGVAILGIGLGVCVYLTYGLEASCAGHIVNNLAAFLFSGFGFGAIQSDVSVASLIAGALCMALYICFIVFAKKKLGWFDKVRRDDAAEFNAKYAERQKAKAK